MKLLILTQVVDRDSAVMGFFHSWLKGLAQEFESITAVGLRTARHDLPSNVKVLSLGKEEGVSRIKYVFRFFRYVWRERDAYDAVFVHMTPIYIILAGGLWKLWNKKVVLWYNHQQGRLLDKVGILLSDKVLYTSPFSLCARFPNSEQMPAGIDTSLFIKSEDAVEVPRSILSLGRISPVKKLHHLVRAAEIMEGDGVSFVFDIVGSPVTAEDSVHDKMLKKAAQALIDKGRVRFHPAVRNIDTPRIYNEHELFINLSPPGLFDKTILESMSCETLVLVSNPSFKGAIPEELLLEEDDPGLLARRIQYLLELSTVDKESIGRQLRYYVLENHGLDNLTAKIGRIFSRMI